MLKAEIKKLRELPIEGVAERLNLRVRRHKTLCPFHDDSNPSLSFSVSRNTYKCFVCGASGGVIDFVMNILGKGFTESCEWLANEHGYILSSSNNPYSSNLPSDKKKYVFTPEKYVRFFEHPFLTDSAMHFLFDERHLDERVIRWCRVNSYRDRDGINWLQIPYYDTSWNLVDIQYRNLDYSRKDVKPAEGKSSGVNTPRFRFPYGSQSHIYNLPVLKMLKPNEPLYIAEGCSDCWALLSSGHKAIAIPSATLLKSSDIELLIHPYDVPKTEPSKQNEECILHMYPDNDKPGETLFLQLKSNLESHPGVRVIRHSLPDGCKDYSDYYIRIRDK